MYFVVLSLFCEVELHERESLLSHTLWNEVRFLSSAAHSVWLIKKKPVWLWQFTILHKGRVSSLVIQWPYQSLTSPKFTSSTNKRWEVDGFLILAIIVLSIVHFVSRPLLSSGDWSILHWFFLISNNSHTVKKRTYF